MQTPHEDKNPPELAQSPVPQAQTSQGVLHSTSASPHIDEDLDQLLSKPGQLERLKQASPLLHWLFTQKKVTEFLSKRTRLSGVAKQVIRYHHIISNWVMPIHGGVAVALLFLVMQWSGIKGDTFIEFGNSVTKGLDQRLVTIGVWFCAAAAALSGAPLIRALGMLFIRPVVWVCHGATLAAVGALLVLVPYAILDGAPGRTVAILSFGVVFLGMLGAVLQAAMFFLDAEEGAMGEARWFRVLLGTIGVILLSKSLWLELHKPPNVPEMSPTQATEKAPDRLPKKQNSASSAASK